MSAILVTGGAGYIGSHTVKLLAERGFPVVVLDNLSTGHRQAVHPKAAFVEGDIGDAELIARIVQTHRVEAVIHFAARSLVGESVAQPDLYFHENIVKTNLFLRALQKNGVKKFVFSSTAAVYGIPDTVPIKEQAEKRPINPYGFSKWTLEQTLHWLATAYDFRWMALRYFNAAGAALDGSIGEHHQPETHLIPILLQTALGQRQAVTVFGTDYNTPDGTCIRDYIHVLDLADAHIRALAALADGQPSGSYNVGTGLGYSVRDLLETAKRVTGINIKTLDGPRRAGDPDVLVADVTRIQNDFAWQPIYSDVQTIIETAWQWHHTHPHGFPN